MTLWNNSFFKHFLKGLLIICIINVFTYESYGDEKRNLVLYTKSRYYGTEHSVLNDIVKDKMNEHTQIEVEKLNCNNQINLDKYNNIYILELESSDEDKKQIDYLLNKYDKKISLINLDQSELKENFLKDKKVYFYLNNINPLSDLNKIVYEVDYLKNNGIEFIAEVPPIFDNVNAKAMRNFTEVLRYIQSNGGRIVLRFPILNTAGTEGNSTSGREIQEAIENGYKNYINYWVYPIAISFDDSILYKKNIDDFKKCSNTIFLDYNENLHLSENYSIMAYKNFIQKLSYEKYDHIYNGKFNEIPYSIINANEYAIAVESDIDITEFKKEVDSLINNETVFINSSEIETEMNLSNQNVSNNIKGTFLNGDNITQQSFISRKEYESYFESKDNKKVSNVSIKANLKQSNKLIKVISAFSLVIFIIILLLSRKIERNKYFK